MPVTPYPSAAFADLGAQLADKTQQQVEEMKRRRKMFGQPDMTQNPMARSSAFTDLMSGYSPNM